MPVRSKVRTKLARDELRRVGRKAAGRFVVRDTRRVLNRARVLSPWDTGTLRSRHTMSISAPARRARVTGRVTVKVKYALPVHEGSKPHIIRPRRRKALAFIPKGARVVAQGPGGRVVSGRLVFAQKVRHPGTKARPWLMTALQEVAAREGYRVRRHGFTDPTGGQV